MQSLSAECRPPRAVSKKLSNVGEKGNARSNVEEASHLAGETNCAHFASRSSGRNRLIATLRLLGRLAVVGVSKRGSHVRREALPSKHERAKGEKTTDLCMHHLPAFGGGGRRSECQARMHA